MILRVVIVDDEAPARERLLGLLAGDREIEVAAVCSGGGEAIGAIEMARPHLVFLDIQMPEVDGFDVIEAVGPENMPRVIFVTAFDRYAAQAFEVEALDYLLKPFDRARFDRALARAKAELRAGRLQPALEKLMRQRPARPRDWVLIRDGEQIHLIRTAEIDRVEAAGNLVQLHVGQKTYLARHTLTALEARLDPERFLRIHRETIVNTARISGMHAWRGGQYRLELAGGTVCPIGRSYLATVLERLGKL